MRRTLLFFLLVLVAMACGTGPVEQEIQQPQPVVSPVDTPLVALDTITHTSAPDTIAPPKRAVRADPTPDVECPGEMGVENNVGHITVYIPKDQLAQRTAEIRDQLPGLFGFAERMAPRSIADDFERGVSTEHSSMPDQLPVEVLVYERCRSTKPHTVLHLRVWREADGSFGSDGW